MSRRLRSEPLPSVDNAASDECAFHVGWRQVAVRVEQFLPAMALVGERPRAADALQPDREGERWMVMAAVQGRMPVAEI